MEAITDEVRQIIARELKLPIERLTPDTKLQELGVEFLDLIEIIFALEEKFDINIPYNANEATAADSREAARAGLASLRQLARFPRR